MPRTSSQHDRSRSNHGEALQNQANDGFLALTALSRLRSEPADESRATVDRVLCEAFLADLADAYRHGFRPRNCLVLVDDVDDDAGLGRSFVTAMTSAKAARADPLVVVVTSRRTTPVKSLITGHPNTPAETRPPPVYVTDGSHLFNDNLRGVEAKIKHENDWVTASGRPYVSIAVLATMSPQPKVEPLDRTWIRHSVEGAHLAQYEANHPSGPAGRPGSPLIRLLLADEGSREVSWSDAAHALEDRIGSEDRLVAVTGLGISVANTRKLIAELAGAPYHMAMVGVLTGDRFSGLPGFVRMAPTNADEAAAAAGR